MSIALNIPGPRTLPDLPGRLIVALDVDTPGDAARLAAALDGVTRFYKIGMWLLYQPGTNELVTALLAAGNDLFLDTKMYDIGETVQRGVRSVAARGARFVTVHGDPAILAAAQAGAAESGLGVLAVTVLTSLDDAAVRAMGYATDAAGLVALHVRAAAAAGCAGVIASAADDPDALREAGGDPALLIVTPGIRMAGDPAGDQRRIGTPADAIARGADYLVVGRPITRAAAPRDAARRILDDMALGQQRRG